MSDVLFYGYNLLPVFDNVQGHVNGIVMIDVILRLISVAILKDTIFGDSIYHITVGCVKSLEHKSLKATVIPTAFDVTLRTLSKGFIEGSHCTFVATALFTVAASGMVGIVWHVIHMFSVVSDSNITD